MSAQSSITARTGRTKTTRRDVAGYEFLINGSPAAAGSLPRSGMGGLGEQACQLRRTGEHWLVAGLDAHVVDAPRYHGA
jgi:hypothetical protein